MLFICPKCKKELNISDGVYKCPDNHCYDIAKQGYVNLLTANKNGSLIGDNKQMAISRREFLNKGYYLPLAETLAEIIKEKEITGNLLDICCGEGYYTERLSRLLPLTFYGFDISKEMVKKASSRKINAHFFVANLSDIPIKSESTDIAIHLFAPFNTKEFSRIIKQNGFLITVLPGTDHLFELKQILYENPYKNDENLPDFSGFKLCEIRQLKYKFTLDNNADIMSLFSMTPYYYKTSLNDKQKLNKTENLTVTADFKIVILKKE